MQIHIHTDNNVTGRAAFSEHVRAVAEAALGRFDDYITRIEVHISDENGDKSSGNDKRCVMEVRLRNRQPIAVTQEAATVDQALHGAAEKLKHRIESVLGRLSSH